jgi:beta-lactamase regulating signal transducer with metallopeptidase domain
MTQALLSVAVQNTALAAALAAVALAVGHALPRRPALAHALWLLVLLKLVTPPLVGLPVWPGLPSTPTAVNCPADAPVVREVATAAPITTTAPPPPSWDVTTALLAVWLVGVCAYWGLAAWRLLRLSRLLRALPDAGLDGYVAELAERFGVTAPRVVLAPGPLPPLLAAVVGRPVLVLPADLWAKLDEAQRRALVLHELAHLARGDHLVRRLELVVLGLCWWNPVAWLAASQLRRVEERCCDAWVVWACPDDAPAYASVLVETLAFLAARPSRLPAGASGAGPVVDIRRRLSMILHGNTPRRLSRAGLLLVAALGVALLPLTPTRAQSKPPETIEALIAATKTCQSCHAAPADGKGHGMKLHDDIVRMMDELTRMKKDLAAREAQLAERQKALADALRQFEKLAAPPAKKAEPSKEELEVLKKLDRLQKELDELRSKLPKPAGKALNNKALPPPTRFKDRESRLYLNQRSFAIPIKRQPGFEEPVRLYVSRDAGASWTLIQTLAAHTDNGQFAATEDGDYWFGIAAESERWPQPGMRITLDTVKPQAEFVARTEDGAVMLTYGIEDANLDTTSPRIEYRTADGWKAINTPAGSGHGVRIRHPAKEGILGWRLRAKDMAGNEMMVEAK